MAEQRLIDANKIYDAVERRYRVSSGIEHRCERDLLDLICEADIVDAVPVVRCKDCKAYEKDCGYCEAMGFTCGQDDFCSYGERRTDNG